MRKIEEKDIFADNEDMVDPEITKANQFFKHQIEAKAETKLFSACGVEKQKEAGKGTKERATNENINSDVQNEEFYKNLNAQLEIETLVSCLVNCISSHEENNLPKRRTFEIYPTISFGLRC